MPDIVLMLGPVVFQNFEVASGIIFGGRQRLAVHHLLGGARVIDTLGRDDGRISFSGCFSGSSATLRARSLDELRASGTVLPITWDVFYYSVVISDLTADYQNGLWIPYRIACTVLRDEASALAQLAVPLATAVAADADAASTEALGSNVDLSFLRNPLTAEGATQRGSANFALAQAQLLGAQATLNGSIEATESSLAVADPLRVNRPDSAVAGLLSATDLAGQLNALATARAYINRATFNLSDTSG